MSLQPRPSRAGGLLRPDAPPAGCAPPLVRAGVRHAFFGRQGGVSGGVYASLNAGPGSRDEPLCVAENRRRIQAALGARVLLGVHQVHSPRAVLATAPWSAAPPQADALVTTERGLALSILTADCAPVLLADPQAGVIGAAHAGWKGALAGVLESTVALMQTHGAEAKRMVAAIGPCIQRQSYEVGPEFQARFIEADAANARFFAPAHGDRLSFDLPAYCAARLAALGIPAVWVSDADTYADAARWFSHRRSVHAGESDYGRNCAAIMLSGAS
ncbi:MAG TPA: peptidoglycan editing factor PgeF [Caulobacterales bacterium]|nr:peptidoglycan editing factor PgeF [Caulobacterales bacterium]